MREQYIFAPIEVIQDGRLTKIQLRVLLGIVSFRDRKTTKPIHPKRSTLAKRIGYSEAVISRTTTQLSKLGWLTKTGKGGFSKPSEYEFHVPECLLNDQTTLTEPVTVDDGNTLTEPVTVTESVTVTEPVQTTLTEPVTRKQQTKTTNKKNIKKKSFLPPCFQDVSDYAKQRGREELAKRFFDYYEVGEWVDGKGNAVLNWKQKFITWERNNEKNTESRGERGQSVDDFIATDTSWADDQEFQEWGRQYASG